MGQCCAPGHRQPFLTHHNTAEIFKQFDTNGNGELEATELRSFFKQAFPETELSETEMNDLVTQFDTDQNGTIGLNELQAFLRCYEPWTKTIQRKTALLVIDVQNNFITGTLAVQNSDSIVKVINEIRDQFDCVVISYDWHPQDHCSFVESANDGKLKIKETGSVGSFKAFNQVTLLADDDRAEHAQMLYPRHCVQKSWGSECHKDLVVKPQDMSVYKGQKANIDSYSAFFDNCKANDTGLTKQLEDAGVTDVYCCGLVFDICVKSSALHGAENGFRVSVIEDACKPLSESEVEPTKKLLAEAGVKVMSSSKATEEVKQIGGGKMALKEFVESVKPHKRAAALHKSETLSSHCPAAR